MFFSECGHPGKWLGTSTSRSLADQRLDRGTDDDASDCTEVSFHRRFFNWKLGLASILLNTVENNGPAACGPGLILGWSGYVRVIE